MWDFPGAGIEPMSPAWFPCTTRKMPNKDLLVKEEEIFRPGVTIDTCYTWGREVRVSFGLLHIL